MILACYAKLSLINALHAVGIQSQSIQSRKLSAAFRLNPLIHTTTRIQSLEQYEQIFNILLNLS